MLGAGRARFPSGMRGNPKKDKAFTPAKGGPPGGRGGITAAQGFAARKQRQIGRCSGGRFGGGTNRRDQDGLPIRATAPTLFLVREVVTECGDLLRCRRRAPISP